MRDDGPAAALVPRLVVSSASQGFEFRPEKSNFVRISPISVGSGK
jgi:hypothetical protein